MKRTTAAALTGVTALVLTGRGAGIALAHDHHPATQRQGRRRTLTTGGPLKVSDSYRAGHAPTERAASRHLHVTPRARYVA